MGKEILRLLAAALAAAAVQVADLIQSGGSLSSQVLVKILVGTVLVRLAGWVVSHFGPAPTPQA